MIIKKTYSELIAFNVYAKSYLEKTKEVGDDKLSSAIKKFNKQLQKHFDEYNDLQDNLQLDNCAVDKNNVILKDENGNRQFTVEGQKKLKSAIKTLLNTTVEIHSRIPDGIDGLIKELSEGERDAFSEIIIPKQEIPNEEKF